jgi:hypothetical protein
MRKETKYKWLMISPCRIMRNTKADNKHKISKLWGNIRKVKAHQAITMVKN